ncbi:MAG: tetratricopeptide repeat protein [Candidatus Rifleibacteriota bacterium]
MFGSQVFALNQDYATLRKFLSARMYGEAYMELLKQEVAEDEFDPKLLKLRKDLLTPTKKRLLKQAEINPDDPAIFTILADICFHQGRLDAAARYATKSLANNSGAMANYVFAKILFRKGNINQAFDQMGIAIESMTQSPVVFADFQFLYSCKSYGVETAKKIVQNTNFLKRAKPIAGDDKIVEAPESPFVNDPTQPPTPIEPDEPSSVEITDINDIDDADLPPDEPEDQSTDAQPDMDELPDLPEIDTDPTTDLTDRPMPFAHGNEDPSTDPAPEPEPTEIEEDPENEKIKKAEYWLDQAVKQFNRHNYNDSKLNLEKAVSLYPGVRGKDELKEKLEAKFDLFKRYKKALNLYELEKYEEALPIIQEAYEQEPQKYPEAPFYIGKIYLLKDNPDLQKALKSLDVVLKEKDLDPLLKRDIEWTKLEILFELERFEEADKLFNNFEKNEIDYAKNQADFNKLKYLIFYNLHKLWIHIGLGIFATLFLIVFLLRLLPAITLAFLKAENMARRAFGKKNYQKACSMAEKALSKKLPVQIEREMLEICSKANFHLKNYVKCQDYSKELLERFADNPVGWNYLARASIACNDTSSEAIAMYETIYRENPENTEYLKILAKHYAETRNYTVESMEILFTYYQTGIEDPQITLALAEGYCQNRTMGNEVITVIEEALKIEDRLEFRELLARNYAKAGRYADAARECLKVLDENLNNMGIHVVYSSSMKKLNMLEEAIEQYENFLERSPDDPQLIEILNGLKKDAERMADEPESPESELPEIETLDQDLPMPDLPSETEENKEVNSDDVDIEGFVEPPPEGFEEENKKESEIPVPDFLKEEYSENEEEPASEKQTENSRKNEENISGMAMDPTELPELDPFADPDSLLDEFATELPEELGGAASPEKQQPEGLDSLDDFESDQQSELPEPQTASHNHDNQNDSEFFNQLSKARELSGQKKWNDVIEILSPVYASERHKDVGLLLINAYIETRQPLLAKEIIDTLDIDIELMSEDTKDILYRTGIALEKAKLTDEALLIFDMICNVDINYRDAFDRSDKLYNLKKS